MYCSIRLKKQSEFIEEVVYSAALPVCGKEVWYVRFLQAETPRPILPRATAIRLIEVRLFPLQPPQAEIYPQGFAARIQCVLKGTRPESRVAGQGFPLETDERTIPCDQFTPLDFTYKVLQRCLTQEQRLYAPIKRGNPMYIAAQTGFVIAVLLLKMLRLQEHSLPPENRAKWLHGTSLHSEQLSKHHS